MRSKKQVTITFSFVNLGNLNDNIHRLFSKFSKNTIQSMLEKAALQTSNQDYSSAVSINGDF